MVSKCGVCLIGWGSDQIWGNDQMEAKGIEGDRIYLRQNKRDRSLLTTLQGSSGQGGREEPV